MRKLKGQPFNLMTSTKQGRSHAGKCTHDHGKDHVHHANRWNFSSRNINIPTCSSLLSLDISNHQQVHKNKPTSAQTPQPGCFSVNGILYHPKPFRISFKQNILFDQIELSNKVYGKQLLPRRTSSVDNFKESLNKGTVQHKFTTARNSMPPLTPKPYTSEYSQQSGFKSARELNDHVEKMHHNAGTCNRKNSCQSCLNGQREHVWPERKILRL